MHQKLRKKPSRGQISLRFQLQTFLWHGNWRNLQSKTWNTDEKTHSNIWGSNIHQYKEVKEKLLLNSLFYVWTIFEHRIKDMYASEKVQVFSCLRRPETQFRHAQGHQLAGALKASINIIHNKIIIVFQVESQKTVNTKLWKRTNWFSAVIKEIFHHNFRES